MADVLYPFGKAHILGLATKVDLIADTLKLIFFDDTDDPYDPANQFVSDLVAGAIIARSGALAGKTVTSGVFDCNDLTVLAVSGDSFERLLLFKDTGVDATSPLVVSWDIATFTPNGSDINVVFNASGLFGI